MWHQEVILIQFMLPVAGDELRADIFYQYEEIAQKVFSFLDRHFLPKIPNLIFNFMERWSWHWVAGCDIRS